MNNGRDFLVCKLRISRFYVVSFSLNEPEK